MDSSETHKSGIIQFQLLANRPDNYNQDIAVTNEATQNSLTTKGILIELQCKFISQRSGKPTGKNLIPL